MNKKGIGGFGDWDKDKLSELAQRAGSAKNPKKGFGSLEKQELSELSRAAANKRWHPDRKEEDDKK